MELKYPDLQLSLIEERNGDRVRQDQREYLAKGWNLNDQAKVVIDTFIQAGFTCLIRDGHPRGRHAEYIGFSRTRNERWFAVIDQYSGRPDVRQITVQRRLLGLLSQSRIPFCWEVAGGNNLFVGADHLRDLVNVLEDASERQAETIDVPVRNIGGARHRVKNEQELEALLLSNLKSEQLADLFGGYTSVMVRPHWTRSLEGPRGPGTDIPDVVLEYSDSILILELKYGVLDQAAFNQVDYYAQNPVALELANGRAVRAAVLGSFAQQEYLDGTLPHVGVFYYQVEDDGMLRVHKIR